MGILQQRRLRASYHARRRHFVRVRDVVELRVDEKAPWIRRFTCRCAAEAPAGEILDCADLPHLGDDHPTLPGFVCVRRSLSMPAVTWADVTCTYGNNPRN